MAKGKKHFDAISFFWGVFLTLTLVVLIGLLSPGELPSPAKLWPKKTATFIPPKKAPAPVSPKTIGYIALIIDDWGYNQEHCSFLRDIKKPVAVAILPYLKHSVDIAQCSHKYGKEVMLHLPLEPHQDSATYPKDYVITTAMSSAKARYLINNALSSIPYVSGVNNHMGSKATESAPLMQILFEELKRRDMFFVDSRTSEDSVCRALSRKIKISFAERDIFLDNINERPAIEAQFALLAQKAQKHGYAVGIAHDRALSLQIIKEQTEALSARGFKFVRVRGLINLP